MGSEPDLQRLIVAEIPPETQVSFKVVHENGKRETIKATLVEYPDLELARSSQGSDMEGEDRSSWLGLEVADLGSSSARDFPSGTDEGVIVLDVESGGFAYDAGIRQGAIVLKIGDVTIENVDDFNEARDRYEDSKKPVVFKIERSGNPRFLAVRTED